MGQILAYKQFKRIIHPQKNIPFFIKSERGRGVPPRGGMRGVYRGRGRGSAL